MFQIGNMKVCVPKVKLNLAKVAPKVKGYVMFYLSIWSRPKYITLWQSLDLSSHPSLRMSNEWYLSGVTNRNAITSPLVLINPCLFSRHFIVILPVMLPQPPGSWLSFTFHNATTALKQNERVYQKCHSETENIAHF